jgi:hypothetical protein
MKRRIQIVLVTGLALAGCAQPNPEIAPAVRRLEPVVPCPNGLTRAELPAGLEPGVPRAEIERKLGPASYCTEFSCGWYERGLIIDFQRPFDGLRSAADLCPRSIEKIAPLEQGVLRVKEWITTRQRWGKRAGFGISAEYDFHAPAKGKLHTRIRLTDSSGSPVRVAFPPARDEREKARRCQAVHQALWPADGPNSCHGVAFYHELDLSAGEHRITYDLEAEFLPEDGGPPQRVTVENATTSVSVTQPPTRWLRLGITRIRVAELPHNDVPDLLWSVTFDGIGRTSEVRDDSRDATWNVKTPWLRVTDDADVDVTVADRDLVYDDQLARLKVAVADLVAAASSGQLVLRSGPVTIWLAVEHSEVRPRDAGCQLERG